MVLQINFPFRKHFHCTVIRNQNLEAQRLQVGLYWSRSICRGECNTLFITRISQDLALIAREINDVAGEIDSVTSSGTAPSTTVSTAATTPGSAIDTREEVGDLHGEMHKVLPFLYFFCFQLFAQPFLVISTQPVCMISTLFFDLKFLYVSTNNPEIILQTQLVKRMHSICLSLFFHETQDKIVNCFLLVCSLRYCWIVSKCI